MFRRPCIDHNIDHHCLENIPHALNTDRNYYVYKYKCIENHQVCLFTIIIIITSYEFYVIKMP